MQSGSRIAHFEVLGLVGAGGMGEVYRARDTRLGRDVAIKVLPVEFAADPERLRRFELEARAVAALSHPNVLAVYDVGTHEGSPFIVSELLEGKTLRDRLHSGGLTVRKAVETAVQIAQGLAAAHEKGIVHRDLKPGNVFLTKDGQVKILDFGIAKLSHPDAPPQPTTMTAEPSTESGARLGTAGYMSPEQVRGLPADHRTDIFSFGCVLQEILSGRSPFRKETTAETMTAILNDDPAPLSGTVRGIPPLLQEIVSRCLEKSPKDRFQSARDLAFDLAVLPRTSDSGTGPMPELAGATRRGRRLIAASAVLIGGAALVLGGALLGRGWSKPAAVRCERLTYRRGFVTGARFAPDGRTVVYSATWDGAPSELFSLRLGTPESTPLGYTHADLLAVSPAGELALFRNPSSPLERWSHLLTAGAAMAVAPFSGGTPKDLDDTVRDADFSPDGHTMAVVRTAQKGSQLEFPIGTVRAMSDYLSCPRISPDGKKVAFFLGLDKLAVVNTDGGRIRILAEDVKDIGGLAWSPSGDEVWYSDLTNQLRAATLSGRKRVVYSQTTRLTLQDMAKDGRVLVTSWEKRERNVFRGPDDTSDRELTWLDWTQVSYLSDDGRMIAFCESEEGVGFKCVSYLRGTDGAPPLRLGEGCFPRLSPDGRFAVALSCSKNEYVIYPVGPGAPRTIPRVVGGVNVESPALLSDNTTICFRGSEAGHGERLWLTDLAGSKLRPVTPEGPRGSVQSLTRDGRYCVVELDGARWLYPLPGGEPRRMTGVLSAETVAAVTADGQSAFVYRRQEVLIRVYKVDLRTGGRVRFREISMTDRSGTNTVTLPVVRMTADGRSYVCSFDQRFSDLYSIEGLK